MMGNSSMSRETDKVRGGRISSQSANGDEHFARQEVNGGTALKSW
jgi:hypothetical protein